MTTGRSPVEGRRRCYLLHPSTGLGPHAFVTPGSLTLPGFGHPGLRGLRPFGTLLVAFKTAGCRRNKKWLRDAYKVQGKATALHILKGLFQHPSLRARLSNAC